MKTIVIIALLAGFIATSVFGQQTIPVKRISVFKNSTCMVMKEGTVKFKDGNATLPVPVNSLYGTYWLGFPKENPLKSVVFKNDTLKIKSKARSNEQILRSNIGKEVTITYVVNEKSEKSVSGKLMDYYPETYTYRIKSDNKNIFIYIYTIISVELTGEPSFTYDNDTIVRTATVTLDKNQESVTAQEYYMQSGVNWIPSYFLKISGEKDMRLEMKATIENYAEDLIDVDAEVVVGSPQLHFGSTPDPMTYDYMTLAKPSSYSYTRYDNNALSNVYQTQQMGGNAGFSDQSPAPDYFVESYETEGEKNNDLYYYKLGKISLPKNSKGNFPIFGTSLTFKDKYTADIEDKVSYYSNQYVDKTNEGQYDVFHSIEFKNATNFPLTTAAVMVVTDKGQFVAQDMLRYTPVGGTASVKLSKAIDILMKNSEEELSRVDNFKKIGRTTYSKVILKGTITIENMQAKAVTVDVTKHVNGTVTVNGGSSVVKKKMYNSPNPYSDLKFEVTLAAGEKKTITYEYEVLFVPYGY
jgi:uncharacterized protein Veg